MTLPSPGDTVLVDAHSAPLRCSLRKRVALKLESICSPNNSSETPRSSSSTHGSYDDDMRDSLSTLPSHHYRADWLRLCRIEAVRVEHSIRKHDHRYYIIHVYQKSTRVPIYRRDPAYAIELPYAAFFPLRDTILTSSKRNEGHCTCCASRVEILREHYENVHDLCRIVRTVKEKEERLEKFLHCLLGISVVEDEPARVVGYCDGCDAAAHALAAFLKRQYERTTGII